MKNIGVTVAVFCGLLAGCAVGPSPSENITQSKEKIIQELEDRAWEQARSEDTHEAYENYLARTPTGEKRKYDGRLAPYSKDARRRIQELINRDSELFFTVLEANATTSPQLVITEERISGDLTSGLSMDRDTGEMHVNEGNVFLIIEIDFPEIPWPSRVYDKNHSIIWVETSNLAFLDSTGAETKPYFRGFITSAWATGEGRGVGTSPLIRSSSVFAMFIVTEEQLRNRPSIRFKGKVQSITVTYQ